MKLTAVAAALILAYCATAYPIGNPARRLAAKDLAASALSCTPCLKKPCNWECDDTIGGRPYKNATASSVDSPRGAGITKRSCICHTPPCEVDFCKEIVQLEPPIDPTGLEISEGYRGTVTHPDQEIPRPVINDGHPIPIGRIVPPAPPSCTRPTITKDSKQEKSEMGECGGPEEHAKEHDRDVNPDEETKQRLKVLDWCTTPECAAARKAAKEAADKADDEEHDDDKEGKDWSNWSDWKTHPANPHNDDRPSMPASVPGEKLRCEHGGHCSSDAAALSAKMKAELRKQIAAKEKEKEKTGLNPSPPAAGMQKRHRLAWNTPEEKRAWLERLVEKAELDRQWHAKHDNEGDIGAQDASLKGCPKHICGRSPAKDRVVQKRNKRVWDTPEERAAYFEMRMREQEERDHNEREWHAKHKGHPEGALEDREVAVPVPGDADSKFWCTSLDCEEAKDEAAGRQKYQLGGAAMNTWGHPEREGGIREMAQEAEERRERYLREHPEEAEASVKVEEHTEEVPEREQPNSFGMGMGLGNSRFFHDHGVEEAKASASASASAGMPQKRESTTMSDGGLTPDYFASVYPLQLHEADKKAFDACKTRACEDAKAELTAKVKELETKMAQLGRPIGQLMEMVEKKGISVEWGAQFKDHSLFQPYTKDNPLSGSNGRAFAACKWAECDAVKAEIVADSKEPSKQLEGTVEELKAAVTKLRESTETQPPKTDTSLPPRRGGFVPEYPIEKVWRREQADADDNANLAPRADDGDTVSPRPDPAPALLSAAEKTAFTTCTTAACSAAKAELAAQSTALQRTVTEVTGVIAWLRELAGGPKIESESGLAEEEKSQDLHRLLGAERKQQTKRGRITNSFWPEQWKCSK